MQTFLPLPNFADSARCLDRARLGKQRVECLQIARVLKGLSSGWTSHPAVLMWAGHGPTLCDYGLAICAEWVARGYQDTCATKIRALRGNSRRADLPWWIGREEFHSSHRAALLTKNPQWYGGLGWRETPRIDYWWPTQHAEVETPR